MRRCGYTEKPVGKEGKGQPFTRLSPEVFENLAVGCGNKVTVEPSQREQLTVAGHLASMLWKCSQEAR